MRDIGDREIRVTEHSLRDLFQTISDYVLRPMEPEEPTASQQIERCATQSRSDRCDGVTQQPASKRRDTLPRPQSKGLQPYYSAVVYDRPDVSLPLVTCDSVSLQGSASPCGTHLDTAVYGRSPWYPYSSARPALVRQPTLNNWQLMHEWIITAFRSGFRTGRALRSARRRGGNVPFNWGVHKKYACLPDDYSPTSEVDEGFVSHKSLLLKSIRRSNVFCADLGPDAPSHVEYLMKFLADPAVWTVEGDEIFQLLLGTNSETVSPDEQWNVMQPCNSLVHRKMRSLLVPFWIEKDSAKSFSVSVVLRRDCYPCLLVSNLLKALKQPVARSDAGARSLHDRIWHNQENLEDCLRNPLQATKHRHVISYLRNVVRNAGPYTHKDWCDHGCSKEGVLRLSTKTSVVDGILPNSKSLNRLPLCPCCMRYLDRAVGDARQANVRNPKFEVLNICQLDPSFDVGDGHCRSELLDYKAKPDSYVGRVQDFVADLKKQKTDFVSEDLILAAHRWFHHRVLARMDPRLHRLVMPPNMIFCALDSVPMPAPTHTLVRHSSEKPCRAAGRVKPPGMVCIRIAGVRSDVTEDELQAFLVRPFALCPEARQSRSRFAVTRYAPSSLDFAVDSAGTLGVGCSCPAMGGTGNPPTPCERCLGSTVRRLYLAPETFHGVFAPQEEASEDGMESWKDSKVTDRLTVTTAHAMRGLSFAWTPKCFLRTVVRRNALEETPLPRSRNRIKKGKMSYLSAKRGKDEPVVWLNGDVSSRKEEGICPFSGLRTMGDTLRADADKARDMYTVRVVRLLHIALASWQSSVDARIPPRGIITGLQHRRQGFSTAVRRGAVVAGAAGEDCSPSG